MTTKSAEIGCYFDNNATTKVASSVCTAMLPFFEQHYANSSSLHSLGEEAAKYLHQARAIIAASIHAEPEEIIFTSSGSESNSLCIKGYVEMHKQKGNHIITSSIEHPSVMQTCLDLQSEGFALDVIPVDSEGCIDLVELKKMIRPETILISVMHANNEIGIIQPVGEVAVMAKQHGFVFHSDMVQSYQKVPINVHTLGVDLASFSGHKIHAPKGIGFVFRKKGIALKRQIFGGNQEFDLRAGTENIPFIVGLAKAVELFSDSDIFQMKKHQEYIIESLLKIPGVRLNGPRDLSRRICNNINVSFSMFEGEFMLQQLNKRGIFVSTGSACSSRAKRISPILQAIHCPVEYIHGNIRISISKYTTDEEIEKLLKHIQDIFSLFS